MNSPPPTSGAPHSGVQRPYGQTSQVSIQPMYVGAPYQPYPTYATAPRRVYENYLSKQSLGLGATMIVAGILCIIFNAVSIGIGGMLSVIAYGIWGGIWFIITGSFGVTAAQYKTRCHVVTFMVLCILSSVTSLVVLILGAIDASTEYSYNACGYYNNYNNNYNGGYYYGRYSTSTPTCQAIIAMSAMVAILSFIVGVASIWGSILCCKVACCCSNTSGQVLGQHQFVTMPGNQGVVYSHQQQQQGGQYLQNPGQYSAPMYTGYPPPMMMSTDIRVATPGYGHHGMNPTAPGQYNPGFDGSGHHHGGVHNSNHSLPPGYDGNKSAMM